jgi:hypothetical protein
MTVDLIHAVIGFPGVGKTTYLAALWQTVTSGEIPSRLTLDELIGDNKYISTIAEKWMRCAPAERSRAGERARVVLHLRDTATNTTMRLTFPDVSGELFSEQFEKRFCPADYVATLNADGGILLFVTANKPNEGLTILEGVGHMPAGAQDAVVEWSPRLVPQEVKMVDVLQFLQQPPFKQRRRRLAVMVSAWDMVLPAAPNRPSPSAWLAREQPILFQFLRTNEDWFETRTYGVSAQGGKFEEPTRTALLNKTPSERIECVGPNASAHDLTAPLSWLSGRD